MGIVYVLDEPSIGLHSRDTEKLVNTIKALQKIGNSIIVVEHDESIIKSADWIIDMGPGAGEEGGTVVLMRVQKLMASKNLLLNTFKEKRKFPRKPVCRRAEKYRKETANASKY